LSADAGRPPVSTAVVALLLGLVALLMVFGFATSAAAILLLAIAFGALSLLSKRQIGGQTGDVLGALEQVSETVVLLVAAAAANTLR
jgi:adenosylcobinamide-GDP ribazoletransferase